MKTEITHLPEHKQEELESVVSFIKEKVPVNMVILFGSFARGDWVEDKYTENGTTYEYKSDFDLLLIVNTEEKALKYQYSVKLEDKISQKLNIDTPCSIIYHGLDYFNAEIKDGSYFFVDILKEGIILYSKENYPLAKPRKLLTQERLDKAKRYYDTWFKDANEFLIDHNNAFERESYKNSIFLLHQAAERFYMTVLLVLTDYKPKTHDLDKLNKSICVYDARFKAVFPRKTDEEERLFLILKKAYIDSRYKLDYIIEKNELVYLSERVKMLSKLTEEVCGDKMRAFEDEIVK